MAADGTVVIDIDINDKDAQSDLSKLKNEFEEAGKSASSAGKGGFSVFKGALADIAGNLATRAVDAVKNLVGEAINASDALFKFEQTMGFAGYDSATIEQARADVKKYADETVYDLGTISNTTAQLAANGIQDFTGLTQAAGNLNAVAGGNADTFKSVAMMLTQTAGAGKLTTENWNQLANAIPGASGKLQEALLQAGAYTGNFRDAMAEGQITAEEFNAAIMQLGNEPVAVEAAKSVQTFEGAIGQMEATVVDGLMQIIDAIGMENITGFINIVTTGLSVLFKIVGTVVSGVIQFLSDIWNCISNFGDSIKQFFDWIVDGVTTLVEDVKSTIDTGFQLISDILNVFSALFSGDTDALMQAVLQLWGHLPDGIKNFVEKAYQWVTEKFNAIKTFLFQTVPETINGVIDWFAQLPSRIWDWLTSAVDRVVQWGADLWNSAKNAASNMVDAVIDTISSLPGRLYDWGVDMIDNFVQGIRNMIGKVKDAASSVADAIRSFLHFSEPDEGPLSDASTYMPDMMEMFAKGIRDNIYMIESAVDQVARTISDGVNESKNAIDSLTDYVAQAGSRLSLDLGLGGLSGTLQGIIGAYNGVSSLKSTIQNLGESLSSTFLSSLFGISTGDLNTLRSITKGFVEKSSALYEQAMYPVLSAQREMLALRSLPANMTNTVNVNFGGITWAGQNDIEQTMEMIGTVTKRRGYRLA